jgi:hypothetical protein
VPRAADVITYGAAAAPLRILRLVNRRTFMTRSLEAWDSPLVSDHAGGRHLDYLRRSIPREQAFAKRKNWR